MNNLLQYSKALVPLAVGAVLALAAGLGVTADMSVRDALTLLFTALFVWLVPNVKGGK